MRRAIALAAAAVVVGTAALVPTSAIAAQAVEPVAAPSFLHPVRFYGAGPHWGGDGWDRRREWRDEARIAEAARREAYRIEKGREQRRAWRRAMREQQHGSGPSYGYGYERGW